MLNRVCLVGRLTRDPESRTTNNGKNVAEFTIAVDKRIKPQDPNEPSANFFRCKAWNQQADSIANYGGKGRLCAVDGRLETRKYVDKDGNNREVVEIVADNVHLLDRQEDQGQSGQGGQQAAPSGGGYSSGGGRNAGGGYSSRGGGQQPQGRQNVPSADEYDPFQDE